MTNSTTALRSLVTYGLILPVALVLGYLLATPLDLVSFSAVMLVLMLMLLPLLMRWHHPLLFLSWNMSAVVFFLPGHPNLWLLMAVLSLGFSIVQRTLSKDMKFLPVASIVIPLLVLAAIVLFTAKQTGGMGLRVFGSESIGGRRYFLIFGAIIGFFAMAICIWVCTCWVELPPPPASFYRSCVRSFISCFGCSLFRIRR
jgi:hypothetical protein